MLQYTLKSPCHQNWDKMTSTTQGKFCAHCQKQVYDLTNKKTVANLPQNFCGRIESYKVTQEISFRKLLLKQNPIRFIAIYLLLLFTKNIKAQVPNDVTFEPEIFPPQNADDSVTKMITISGVLLDEKTKETIPFGNVVIYNDTKTQLGVSTTDIDGKYSITLPIAAIHGKTLSIKAVYVGYKAAMIVKVPIKSLKQNISLSMGSTEDGIMLVGLLVSDPGLYDSGNCYLHEEDPQKKHTDDLFTSEFDTKTPTRHTINKP